MVKTGILDLFKLCRKLQFSVKTALAENPVFHDCHGIGNDQISSQFSSPDKSTSSDLFETVRQFQSAFRIFKVCKCFISDLLQRLGQLDTCKALATRKCIVAHFLNRIRKNKLTGQSLTTIKCKFAYGLQSAW